MVNLDDREWHNQIFGCRTIGNISWGGIVNISFEKYSIQYHLIKLRGERWVTSIIRQLEFEWINESFAVISVTQKVIIIFALRSWGQFQYLLFICLLDIVEHCFLWLVCQTTL